jgi:hypothetical protein
LIRFYCVLVLTSHVGDSPAELVAVSNSYAMRRRLKALLDKIKGPDGPAFVVLNDDMPERQIAKEYDTLNQLMLQWMEKLWPEKVWIYACYPCLDTLPNRFGIDVLGILTSCVLTH